LQGLRPFLSDLQHKNVAPVTADLDILNLIVVKISGRILQYQAGCIDTMDQKSPIVSVSIVSELY
jgi:hypothetical protein